MQDRAGLIHAKLPHEFHADHPGLVHAPRIEFGPLRSVVIRSANIPALRSELHASPQSFDRCLANGPLMAELRLFHTAQQNRDEVNPATEKAA